MEADEDTASRAVDLVRRLASGKAVDVDALPESAKTLQMVRRSSPELFAQLVQSVGGVKR